MALFSKSVRVAAPGLVLAVMVIILIACEDPTGSDDRDDPGDDIPRLVDATLIPDENLRRAIADEVGVETDELNVSHLAQVTSLDGAEYGISDLTGIGNLENLRDVEFWGNSISDLTPLFQVSGLEWLEVTDNPLTYNALSVVTPARFPNLKYLFVSERAGTLAANANELLSLFDAFSPMRGIGIEQVPEFRENMWDGLAGQDSLELTHLWLRGNDIDNDTMGSIGDNLVTLEELRIDGNTGVTSIESLATPPMLTKLHRIHIRGTGVNDLTPLQELLAAGVFDTGSARVDVRDLNIDLTDESPDRAVIDALIAAGVSVRWEQGNTID